MDLIVLADALCNKIAPWCRNKKDPGQTGGDARMFLEGALWIARTGAKGGLKIRRSANREAV